VDFCIIERRILLLLKLDEDQHKSYPAFCESRRPIIAFIPLNPENYTIDCPSGKAPLKDWYEAVMKSDS
jgi:hypothetical protein